MLVKKIIFCLMLWLVGCSLVSSAYAACVGIGCTCNIAATAIAFENYNPLNSSALTSTGTVSVTCSALVAGLNVSYAIGLNKGNANSFSPRVMKSSGNQLQYNLYTDTLRSIIWGDGTGGTSTVSDTYNLNLISATRNYSAYALLPALQNVVPGDYSDKITATVTF